MSKAKIFYFTLQDEQTKDEKLDWFERSQFEAIPFDHITPDQKENWINLTDNDFYTFLPLIDKEVKAGKSQEAVFQLFSRGVATQRDEWVYDFSKEALIERMKYFVEAYGDRLENGVRRDLDIKWDRELEKYFERRIKKKLEDTNIVPSLYRCFTKNYFYFDKHFNGMTYQMFSFFPNPESENKLIGFMGQPAGKPFSVIATNLIPDLNCISPASGGTQCIPFYRYDKEGTRIDNITDWALQEFCDHYCPSPPQPSSPAGEEGAGAGTGTESGDGAGAETGSEIKLPSPAGEGLGVRANNVVAPTDTKKDIPSPTEDESGLKINELTYLVGARREIPDALLQRAKTLRQQQTPAEKILWECLRGNRLYNAKFRRQHNVAQYIADFYCHAAKLVIELDGEIHQTQKDRDGDRNTWMQANGLTVLRFDNQEILQNIEKVLQHIISYLPSPAGEGLGVRANSTHQAITKLDIFHYTYAILHHPAYRTKYELNLKREFPRLPFYSDFHQWATWGKALMDLHLNYETIAPYDLIRQEIATKETPKAKLKADKPSGIITLDENTQLISIPAIAWEYKLGNRSALEWILDQYKEKKPKDPTIAKLFNTYKFADYKEHVIDLLQRVCTVSVETIEIIQQMPTLKHEEPKPHHDTGT